MQYGITMVRYRGIRAGELREALEGLSEDAVVELVSSDGRGRILREPLRVAIVRDERPSLFVRRERSS